LRKNNERGTKDWLDWKRGGRAGPERETVKKGHIMIKRESVCETYTIINKKTQLCYRTKVRYGVRIE